MIVWTRIERLSPRARRLLAGALAVSLALGAIWFARREDSADEAARGQPRTTVPEGAVGMEGMDMGGMDMNGDGSVRLSPDQVRAFGVTFATVEERILEDEVRTVGIVAVDETRLTRVTLRFDGYVERLYVDFTGRTVRAGERLLDIYSAELVAAQEELLLAAKLEASLPAGDIPGVPRGSSNLLAAARQRLRLWDISEAQIDEVLASGRVRRALTLFAPASGVVIEKNVLAGQAVQAGQELYTIANLAVVWVEAELREADAGMVREGTDATVELSAYPGRPITERVQYVYPTIQEQARTLKARIAVSNPDGRLKPGMFATVRLFTPLRAALAVPASAVLSTGERRVVFVDLGGGRLRPQEVQVGRVAGDFVEILYGLEPGQRVVTSAQYLLDSESNLAEVMRSMIGMTAPADMEGMNMGGTPAPRDEE